MANESDGEVLEFIDILIDVGTIAPHLAFLYSTGRRYDQRVRFNASVALDQALFRLRSLGGPAILAYLALGALGIAVGKAVFDLSSVLVLHAKGALENDTLIYFTVARGMLNGLEPYRDLFESKPPGMFLLAVLSLLVSNGPGLATIADLLALAVLPVLLLVYGLRSADSEHGWVRKYLVALSALLLGVQLILYVEERVGPVQSEVFGGFFASLYVLLVLYSGRKTSWGVTFLSAALLMAAIGMKEPFVLTILAAVCLVVASPRELLGTFVLPLVIACIGGIVGLWALGALPGYFHIYLPAMLEGRVSSNPMEPFFIRGFAVAKVLYNLTVAYTAPGFGVLLGILWLFFPIIQRRVGVSGRDLILTGAVSIVAYYLLTLTWLLAVVGYGVMQMDLDWETPFMAKKIATYIAVAGTFAVLLFLQVRRGLAWPIASALLAAVLVSATVGMAGYANQHWGFATPVLFALILMFVRYASAPHPNPVLVVVVFCVLLFTVFTSRPSAEHLGHLTGRLVFSYRAQQPVVRQFDRLLESCGIERYASLGVFEHLAFSIHSPLGPLFVTDFHQYLGRNHVLFQQTADNIREHAEAFVVLRDASIRDQVGDVEVTKEAPTCAKPYLPLPTLDVWFREESGGKQDLQS